MQILLTSKEVNGKSKFSHSLNLVPFSTKLDFREQDELRERRETRDRLDFDPENLQEIKYIAGVDLSFPPRDEESAVACLVVLSMPDLKVTYIQVQVFTVCITKNVFFVRLFTNNS